MGGSEQGASEGGDDGRAIWQYAVAVIAVVALALLLLALLRSRSRDRRKRRAGVPSRRPAQGPGGADGRLRDAGDRALYQ